MTATPARDPRTLQDMHVHSTFSDGADSIAENIAEAERLGLRELTCVDHVRESTDWVPDYVAAVGELRPGTELTLRCAIEAKLLDTDGALDLPDAIDGVDAIYAADHQVPLADGPHHPREVRESLQRGERGAAAVLEAIVTATERALDRPEQVVIAHLFSVLPKLGLHERDVPPELIERLADGARRHGARIEIDERWRCPSAATVRPFVEIGVPLLLSTDSHRRETIGRYDYCLGVLRDLDAEDNSRAGP
jgi:putative hydrolase